MISWIPLRKITKSSVLRCPLIGTVPFNDGFTVSVLGSTPRPEQRLPRRTADATRPIWS